MFREKVNFAAPIVRFIHLCQLFFHSNAGSVSDFFSWRRDPFRNDWETSQTNNPRQLCPPGKPMALGVCPGHGPSQAQPFGCTTIQHSQTSLEKGQRQGPGETGHDLCEDPGMMIQGYSLQARRKHWEILPGKTGRGRTCHSWCFKGRRCFEKTSLLD